MKVSTDCSVCTLAFICPLKDNPHHLPAEEGGFGLCPKLIRASDIRCSRCRFAVETTLCHRYQIFKCLAISDLFQNRNHAPKTTLKNCPIKKAKRKGL